VRDSIDIDIDIVLNRAVGEVQTPERICKSLSLLYTRANMQTRSPAS
jgi:hypothetical protein